jgi:hypothetical protein
MLQTISLTVCSDITSHNISFVILTITRTADLTEHTRWICKVILKTKHKHCFFIIKPTRCTNFTYLFWHEIYMFGTVDSFRAGPGWNPSGSCSKAVYKPVWHIPLLYSVQWINSWWWTDELFKTYRVSSQTKFVKLVHQIGFTIKKFVAMHGHTNVKFFKIFFPWKRLS